MPEKVLFKSERAEREGPADNMTELSVEFELEWVESAAGEGGGTGQLEIG